MEAVPASCPGAVLKPPGSCYQVLPLVAGVDLVYLHMHALSYTPGPTCSSIANRKVITASSLGAARGVQLRQMGCPSQHARLQSVLQLATQCSSSVPQLLDGHVLNRERPGSRQLQIGPMQSGSVMRLTAHLNEVDPVSQRRVPELCEAVHREHDGSCKHTGP